MEDKSKPGKSLFVFGEVISDICVLFVLGFVALLGLADWPNSERR